MPASVVTRTNYVYGATTYVAYAPYVAAKAAGTFVDVGATAKPVELDFKRTDKEIEIEQQLGISAAYPIKRELDIKWYFQESTMAHLVTILGLPTSALSAGVLKINPSAPEIYYQLQIISPGIVTKVRTDLFWRCYPKAVEKMILAKKDELVYGLTWGVIEEPDSASLDNWGKITEA